MVIKFDNTGDSDFISHRAGEILEGSVSNILFAIGEHDRDGTFRTPERYANFLQEFLSPAPFELTTFEREECDQMVVVRGIRFYSICEHHLLPFFGSADVAYLPGEHLIGLSKIARLVDWHSRKLQNQERITTQIASSIEEHLDPVGVGVVLRARHLCMEMRGIQKQATTVTSALTGAFRDDEKVRSEFLDLSRSTQEID